MAQPGLDLVAAERAWLLEKQRSFLECARAVLRCIGNATLEDEATLKAAALLSPEQAADFLGPLVGGVFRSLLGEAEWAELNRSAACVARANVAEARRLRLERQKKMLAATCLLAVPREADEELWSACAEEVVRACDTFGVPVRRAAVVKSRAAGADNVPRPSTRRAGKREQQPQQESEEEQEPASVESADDDRDGQRRVAVGAAVTKRARLDATAIMAAAEDEEQEEEDDDGSSASSVLDAAVEAGDDAPVLHALQRARGEVEELRALVEQQQQSGHQTIAIAVGELVAPDPAAATAHEGLRILRDPNLLLSCLCEDDRHEETPLEQLGLLRRWWRLLRRCYGAVAILEHFATSKSKQHVVALYNERARSLRGVCTYWHATRLERLGRLVLRFPRLCYQTQLISLAAWFQHVPSTGRPLLASLDGLLGADDAAFWALRVEACGVCDGSAAADRLWRCTQCSCWFHEACAGYAEDSLCASLVVPEGQVIETRVLCAQCSDERGVDRDDVARETREKRAVAAFLNAPGCPFVLQQREGSDGAGCFRLLFEFAAAELAYRRTFPVFCRALAWEALAEAVADSESVAQLRRVEKSRDPARDLQNGAWAHIDLQQVLRGFVRLCPGGRARCFVVNGDAVTERDVYGEGDRELCMLQWAGVTHFDRLTRAV